MNNGVLANTFNFKSDVTLWVTLDNQLKVINEKTKKMREMKQAASERICQYIADNNVKNKIKISDGELKAEIKVYEKKEYSPLTFSYVENCLKKIIHDEEQVDYVIQFLKENREITTSPDIRKVLDKPWLFHILFGSHFRNYPFFRRCPVFGFPDNLFQ